MFDDPGSRDELSAAERRALDALPRELEPGSDLEERTVALLRAHGRLPIPIAEGRAAARGRWGGSRRPLWIGVAAAASLAIFASGMAVGQLTATRSMVTLTQATRDITAAQAADHIRQAGRLYIQSLATLNELPDSVNPAGRDHARQVALSMLGLAAQEVAHIAPDDPLAAAVLRGLDQRGREQRPAPPSRTVVWF